MIYHNSLPVDANVSPDIHLAHHGFGTVIHRKTEIGRGVTICHNVTIAVQPSTGASHGIVIEDGVFIGANSVVITTPRKGIRIGRGAKIGAGAVVTHDVPAGATVISAPVQVLTREAKDSEPAA